MSFALFFFRVASQICNGIDYNDDLFGFWKADLLAEGMFQLKLSPDKLENFFAWFNYLEKCLAWSKDCDRKKLFSELRQLVLRCSDYLHLQFPQPPQSVLPCIPVPKKSIETNLQSISSVNQSSKSIKESRSQLRTPDSVDQIWKAPTPTASFGVMNTASTTTKESSDQITPSPAASRHSGYLKQVTSTTKPSLDQMQSSSISKKNLEQIHTSSKAISLSSKDSRDGHISTTAQEPLNLISPISSISKDSRALVKDVSTSKQNVDNISGTSKKSSYNEMTNSMFFQEVQQLHSAMRRNSENKKTNLEDFVNIMEVLYSM
ncbi:hypothetical protein C0J52_11781 [Blattella germanica]|nr:hypothetical protein C0J52_11781 [Blattella germanica]